METVIFLVFALAAAGGALMVVFNQNVARMAFWLIVSLGSTAGLFFMMGAEFVGAAQLLIYVGGTVVLLIFGVMLTGTSPYLKIKANPGDVLQAAMLGLVFFGMLVMTVMAVDWEKNTSRLTAEYGGHRVEGARGSVRSMGTALLGARFDQDSGGDHEQQQSAGYLLPFEIISIHLLVVLIGASYLARAKRRQT
ncbi:MAG: NADH-quinone oxidoreductase subunit J [Planctomycetaceae bacterium]